MDDKMIDRILNNLIAEAGPIAIDNMTKEDLKSLDNASDVKFSKKPSKPELFVVFLNKSISL